MSTTPVFLVSPELLAGAAVDATVTLSGPEAHHAVKVRRLTEGESVDLVDGAGRRVSGVVAAAGDDLAVSVRSVLDEPEPTPRLTVVQALAKGDRSERAVEMLTEVGVDTIVPWSAERGVSVWRGDKVSRGPERWRSVAAAAAKQSRRARLPHITAAADTEDVSALLAGADRRFVLHESAVTPLAGSVGEHSATVVLVVGPEGGITPMELERFASAGATSVRLGDSVLRTSTAGVAAAAVVLAESGRWAER